MPPSKTYDLFISHAWQYGDDYYKLVQLLGNGSPLSWRDQSVPRCAPLIAKDYWGIQEALALRIFRADAVLAVSRKYLDKSRWVQYELSVARAYGKPIIGIQPWRDAPVSREVRSAATSMVDWAADSIAHAVKTLG